MRVGPPGFERLAANSEGPGNEASTLFFQQTDAIDPEGQEHVESEEFRARVLDGLALTS